jgi:hypothetical protein
MVKVGARLRKLPHGGAEVDDAPRLRRCHCRIGKVELGLVALSLRLRETGDGAAALRLQRLDLPLRQLQRRLRARHRGSLLTQLRTILLGILNAARAFLRQILVARVLLLREHQRRLRLIHLRLVGADLRLLHLELRVDVLDAGLRRRHLSLGLIERDAVIAVVDAGDHVAGGDVFVIGDGDRGDVAGHLGSERGLPCRDEGVVGGLKVFAGVQVEIAAAEARGEKHGADGGDNGAARQEAKPVPFASGLRLSSLPANG